MLSRRTFSASSALAATMAALPLGQGKAAKPQPASVNVNPRGDIGRLRRLPTLDEESKIDLLAGMGAWVGGEMASAAKARADELIAKSGVDTSKPASVEETVALFGGDPVIGLRNVMWQATHTHTYDVVYGAFDANGEAYLAELEAHDAIGPGSLKLNPQMEVPEYTRHEIHQQAGGYVGNPFAGNIYHVTTNQFYRHANDQDQRHAILAAAAPPPADGKVQRILDLGTGIGQLAVAMKDRFPEAEVHGVDIGAPMLRYGHMHAVNLGSDVHFTQALAEKTGFPDGHFDVVVSYLIFHEVTAEASKQILQEVSRILRPGGVFFPIDLNRGSPTDIYHVYSAWWDHRWNDEHWRLEYAALDFDGEMQKAGFEVQYRKDAIPGFSVGQVTGIKKA